MTEGGVSVTRITVPIVLVAGILIGAVAAAAVHWNSLARISALEDWRANVEGNQYSWRRRDQLEWVLLTQNLNTGWKGWDPYRLPSGRHDGGMSSMALSHDDELPPIWGGVRR
jgi:hypothetical protein